MNTQLYKLIQEGEHQQQDFKYCINDSKKIARSMVAFANTDGGRLLIGIKDNGKIAGVKSDEEFYMAEAAAKIYSKPAIHFKTRQWLVEGKTVLEIKIEPSTEKPHFALDETGKWLAYIRIHDENYIAHKIQLNVWKKQKSKTGIYFSYSSDEKFLIDLLLEFPSVTFSKYFRLANISRKKAEIILTNFVVMNVVTLNCSASGTTFSLNKQLDQSELNKFITSWQRDRLQFFIKK